MKIHSTLHIGSFHTNHCEDFLIIEPIGSGKWLIAVMDGCTMGKESVFAAMLAGKILRNIARKLFFQEMIRKETPALETELKEVLRELFAELKFMKNRLGLETEELLSTLIAAVIDEKSSRAALIAIGDGLVQVDGKLTEYEQNDKPDYFGYHLSENFDAWFEAQEQRLSVERFQDLSICTDGIYTFKNFTQPKGQRSEREIIDFLLKDREGAEFDNFLDRKVLQLKEELEHVVTDDLSIVRILAE